MSLVENKKINAKVTIVTSVFNSVEGIENTIKSVVNQCYSNIEYIIIDGGSKDGSLDIIQKYSEDISHWISEKDDGIYDAWNKALNVASGKWILFLGAGDFLRPNGISLLMQKIESSEEEFDIVSGRVRLFNSERGLRTIGHKWSWERFRKYMCIAHPSTLHNKSYFLNYGHFNKSYKIAGDYELLLRARSAIKSGFVEEVIVDMQAGGISDGLKVFQETLKAQQKHKTLGKTALLFNNLLGITKFFLRKLIVRY